MKTINDILADYTTGAEDLETTNKALKEAGATYHLDPGKNEITEQDRRETTVGYYPDQANGWGLLDTGTGTLDKVRVNYGRLVFPVNQLLPGGSVNMDANVIICDKVYAVIVDKLTEPVCESCKVPPLPQRADLSRKTELAGQVVTQRTKSGTYEVTYDRNGYAVNAKKVKTT